MTRTRAALVAAPVMANRHGTYPVLAGRDGTTYLVLSSFIDADGGIVTFDIIPARGSDVGSPLTWEVNASALVDVLQPIPDVVPPGGAR